jgi:hypothetical protein
LSGKSLAVHQAHAASATAGAGLDHQRVADAFGFALKVASSCSAP